MKSRIRKAAGALSLVCLISLATHSCAAEQLLQGGDFEGGQPLSAWTVKAERAKVQINRPAGRWIPVTVTFNSEDCTKVTIYIGAYASPSGRCWVDNIRAKGFRAKNPSFEELTADGKSFAGWSVERPGQWLHVSRERASDGKVSVMYHDASYATRMIRLSQRVDVKPNTDYSYTYDFYMDDDFYGAIRCSAIAAPPAAYRVLKGDYTPLIDDLIADRAAAGCQQCNMVLEGGGASLSQEAIVPAQVHLEAGVSVKAKKGFEGSVTLSAGDADSKELLASTSLSDTGGIWERLKLRFVSGESDVDFRIAAEGEGTVLLDGATLSAPRLRPTPQSVEWRTVADDFALNDALAFQVEGASTEVLETGLSILRKDLEGIGVALAQKANAEGPLVVRIAGDLIDFPADKGPEAHRLDVDSSGVRIEAPTDRGAFYGLMTLAQLLSRNAEGKAVVTACEVTDWPDLPWRALNRGAPGLTPEWMARRKLNVAFHINERDIPEFRRHGIMPIPHDNITHYPYHTPPPEWPDILKDPNIAEGAGKEETLTLRGLAPTALSERNVIRTGLTDVTVKSADGKTRYERGKDFRVIDGEISCPFKDDAKPFAIARTAESGIANGATVLVSYEHVARHTGTHPVLCLAEPAPQEAVAQRVKEMVEQGDLPFIGLHVSEEPRIIGKGPRCQATGLSASELLARYYERLDAAIKEANPDCRLITLADDFMPWQHSPRSGLAETAKMLPTDAIAHCWGYAASQAVSFNVKCAKLWTELGHDFLMTGWYDYTNLRTVAAAALWARNRGMPCLGTSSWAYNPDRTLKEPGAFIEETAVCAWRVPREGEEGYVNPAEFDRMLEKINIEKRD